MPIKGRSLVDGAASGDLLVSNMPLSCWGGVDPNTGIVVDRHHPLRGECLTGRILAIPCGRGSCTGSGIILELLLRKRGPAALVFYHVEEILTLGVMVARVMFGREVSIPVLVISAKDFPTLRSGRWGTIRGSELQLADGYSITPEVQAQSSPVQQPQLGAGATSSTTKTVKLKLTQKDERMLAGAFGPAAKLAMEILVSVAEMQGAEALLDVSQAHIDACIYIGPASLDFAEKFQSLGARFAVPTTLNSISIDQRRWKEIGMDPVLAKEAQKLAQAYMSMGASMSFTCAPYLLHTAPGVGENIGWAESNAVVFANSVLGARTQKYPDFLDVCIALTGRAPAAGCHLEQHRVPKLKVSVSSSFFFFEADDTFYPLLGYHIGTLAGPDIPLICGLENLNPSISDLKAFGAAFATTASAPMFHILGVTPEAEKASLSLFSAGAGLPCHTVTNEDLRNSWYQLNTASDSSVGLVSLGNPHFSLEEFATLARLCSGLRRKHANVEIVVTTSRAVSEKASEAGFLDVLDAFGARVITDTCWCMLGEPVVPIRAKNIMTNSAKYAHYAPGLVQRGVHFGSLSRCVEAACKGEFGPAMMPEWLTEERLELKYMD
ncbi:hypothetical protein LTR41_000203 [Exophiala xenobiotica]|nr:hypothetical protein LTR41_000203 [Exophiala xenobiotica]